MSSLAFLYCIFIQEDVALSGVYLPVEVETHRSLLFLLDGLLVETQSVCQSTLNCTECAWAHFFPFTSQPLNWRQSRWWMLQLCSRSACSCPANKANHHLFQKVKLCGCELDENFIFRSIRARIVNPNSAVETVTGLHQDLHSNQQQNQWVDS